MLQSLMAQATTLTRQGDLQAATAAIQRALSGAVEMPLRTPHGTPSHTTPGEKAPMDATAKRPDIGLVLDGLTRVINEPGADDESHAEHLAQEIWERGSFTHAGRTLSYRVFVPPASSASQALAPRPMIVMLHGCTQDADDFAVGTRMNALAREHGFIVLYPEQAQRSNAQKCWNWFKPQHQARGRGEPAVIAAMTMSIAERYGADTLRLYVAGLSAGGAMADIVARSHPEIFAAVGVHSGLGAGSASDLPGALSAMRGGGKPLANGAGAALPTIVFHGDCDRTVHKMNGDSIVAAASAAHAARDGEHLQTDTTVGISPGGQRFTRTTYGRVDRPASVEQWLLHGAGHAWSGGSMQGSFTDANGVDASAEMVRFFLAHRRAR